MVQKVKVNVKERFYEGQIDLSMSDLDDVPVKEIAAIKKTHSLDLSNNRLTALPAKFSSLTFLTKLDLSKNGLTELPEDFGNLIKLRYLDLYSNKLDHLPLSLGQLTALRFLDLKDNPLMPAIAKVAGPCVDNKGCQQCARDVVQFYRKLQEEVKSEVEMRNKERQKQLEINQKKKQEEKKKQKKNKVSKSSKAETVKTEESVGKNIVKKVANKKEKQPLKRQNHIFGYLSLVLVLTIVLWFLFALYPPISNFGPTINNFYQTNVISRLPTDYRNYGLHVGDFIRLSQIRTKNATISLFGKVVESEIYKTVAKKVEYLLASKK